MHQLTWSSVTVAVCDKRARQTFCDFIQIVSLANDLLYITFILQTLLSKAMNYKCILKVKPSTNPNIQTLPFYILVDEFFFGTNRALIISVIIRLVVLAVVMVII